MNLGFDQHVALVTGGSQGIGRSAALSLGAEGVRVAVTYRNNPALAAQVVEALKQRGADAMAVPLDLADLSTVDAAVKQVLQRWGRIDVLINNAVQWSSRAPWNPPPFESIDAAEWQSLFRQNSEAAYAAIQRVLPSMRERKWGRIINVSSGIAVDGLPGAGPYAAAKGALHALTRTLCKELGPAGVLINVVMPGWTMTDRMLKHAPAEARAQAEKASPIRRLLGPDEVVPLMTFLSSPLNTAVTGEIIRASGGIT